MSDNNKGNVVRQSSESQQIDLIDVLIQLWRGKLTILICMFFTLTLAVAYLLTIKDKWVSTAIVSQPDVGQIANYTSTLLVLYSPVQPMNNSDSGNTFLPSISDVQRNTFERFASLSNALSDAKGIGVENIKPPQQQPVYNPLPLQFTYSAGSAEEAKKVLSQYVAQINRQVVADLSADLELSIVTKIRELGESLSIQEKIAQEQKSQRMELLNHSLELAEKSGITRPANHQLDSTSSDSLYLLGSEELETIIEGESGRPLSFSDEYYKTREKLLTVEALKPEVADMSAFRYVMEPDAVQQTQNMKKRATILFMALLLGGVLGSGIVLVRNAIREYQQRNQA